MPAVSDVISIAISATSATPAVPGYGKPLVLAQDCPAGFTNRYREYSDTAGAETDGFAATSKTVAALAEGFAQDPRPPLIGVGRRANKTTQALKLTLGSVVAGDVYSVTLVRPSTGVSTTVTRVSTGVPATDATALAATIAAVSGFAGTSAATGVITITCADGIGTIARLKNWTVNGARSASFTLLDSSADPGIAADLDAIKAEDNSWYGLSVDSCSKAEILAAAAWAQTNKKLLVQQSSDSGVPDSGTSTDIASAVQAAAYDYAAILYNGNDTWACAGLAWMSKRFAATPTPGNENWAYNTLAGITVDNLTESEVAALGNKNGQGYCTVDTVNMVFASGLSTSKSAGRCGSGEFIDVRRFLDWQAADMQTSVFAAIANGSGKKVPMTDKGGALLGANMLGSLKRGEINGGNVEGSSLVNVPLVSSLSASDRANRVFSGITWSVDLAGAVNLVEIVGNVTT